MQYFFPLSVSSQILFVSYSPSEVMSWYRTEAMELYKCYSSSLGYALNSEASLFADQSGVFEIASSDSNQYMTQVHMQLQNIEVAKKVNLKK